MPLRPKFNGNAYEKFLDCEITQDRNGLFYILVPFTFKWQDVRAIQDLWNEENNGEISGCFTAKYPERMPWISEFHYCIYLQWGY